MTLAHKRAYDRQWYARQSPSKKKHIWQTKKSRRERLRKAVYEYLQTHPCACGEADPIVLEFDHNSASKRMCISDMVRCGWAEKNIFQEIAKCIVRCANCHRRRTAKQFGWFKALTGQ